MRFSFAVLFASTVAAEALANYQVFERLSTIPAPWIQKEDTQVNLDQNLKLRIHLRNRNIEEFHQKVLDVSTPDHVSYGEHLSREGVNSFLAPSKNGFTAITEWIQAAGLSDKATIENDWIVLHGTIADAQRLLQTKYELFENTETGKTTIRVREYSLPRSLHAYVDIVSPTIKFTTLSPQISTIVKDFPLPDARFSGAATIHDGLNVTACNLTITPSCLSALYQYTHFRASRRNGNEIALAGFLEEYAQHDDLAQFISKYEPAANGSDFATVLINGGLNLQVDESGPQEIGEANLDIQYGLAIAYPTPSTYYSTGGRPPETTPTEVDNEPYLEFLTYLLAQEKIPQTISISYGDGEWTVPESYAITVCNLFAQVAARGVSVLVSSGDSGSGSNCSSVSSSQLLYTPDFPASCPYVTAVGATRYVLPEVAVSFSGGGFSNYFPRPSYQDAAVSTYLKTSNSSFTKYFNASGRAYPDVSAQGVYFHTILNGADSLLSGTSASSPAFAGVVALLNSDRISNGLRPFGFLNPWLYSKAASALTDITGGKSSGCAAQIPGSGFAAVSGWDPVTGLGTPDFKKLRLASTGIYS